MRDLNLDFLTETELIRTETELIPTLTQLSDNKLNLMKLIR